MTELAKSEFERSPDPFGDAPYTDPPGSVLQAARAYVAILDAQRNAQPIPNAYVVDEGCAACAWATRLWDALNETIADDDDEHDPAHEPDAPDAEADHRTLANLVGAVERMSPFLEEALDRLDRLEEAQANGGERLNALRHAHAGRMDGLGERIDALEEAQA